MIKLAATGASEESSQIILVQLVQNWHEERSHPHRPGRHGGGVSGPGHEARPVALTNSESDGCNPCSMPYSRGAGITTKEGNDDTSCGYPSGY